jgi:integrase
MHVGTDAGILSIVGTHMAREIFKLSPAHVRHAKVGLHADGGGLYLQVTASKTSDNLNRSWIFRYNRNHKPHHMGLGSVKTIGLSEAREEAERWRKVLLTGKDPIEVRAAERATNQAVTTKTAVTFQRAAETYMAAHEAGWRNAKHRAQWTSTLSTYAYPVIGALPVDVADTSHIMQILGPIWAEKNETASRLRGRIRKILDWAKVKGYRAGDNPAAWTGHLEHLLAKRSDVHKEEHHPALPWEQIPEFMAELRQQAGIAAKALEFTILTAARSGESRGLPWTGEIAGDVWTVPAPRMKGEREHRVPLTAPALVIIEYMRQVRQNDYVFPGDQADEPLSDMSLTAVIRRMNEAREKAGKPKWIDPKQSGREVVPHGFRSTFRDWVDDDTPFADWIAEAALAHAKGDKVEAAYKRGDALKKRRKLMEAWGQHCAGTWVGEEEAPDNAVPMQAAAE